MGAHGCQQKPQHLLHRPVEVKKETRIQATWANSAQQSVALELQQQQLTHCTEASESRYTNYQMALSKQGAGGGSATHKEPT